MDIIWAPWRIDYILNDKDSGCFLCEAFESAPGEDNQTLVLARGRLVLSLLNRYPYNSGHLLVAPVRHIADLSELSGEEMREMMLAVSAHVQAVKKAMAPEGFNIGLNLGKAAGAGLESHLHMHIVPRWTGDTNFLAATANAKVIPEALIDTMEKIKAELDWPAKPEQSASKE